MTELDFFRGRYLLEAEVPVDIKPLLRNSKIKKIPCMLTQHQTIQCQRCGMVEKREEVKVALAPQPFYYCPSCLILGKVESRQAFYYVEESENLAKRKINFKWGGTLTEQQQRVSKEVIRSYRKGQDHMISAVTGAGKTEMLFPLVKKVLGEGKRIAIASPRVDVCLELYPRFQEVFPDERMALLHGNQTEKYVYSPFVICTTHQLLRFKASFDVIVVDEVDAFPYKGNEMLAYGMEKATKSKGSHVFLTATPDKQELERVRKGELGISQAFQRYHGYPLPVPKSLYIPSVSDWKNKGTIPRKLAKLLAEANKKYLIFFPNIEMMMVYYKLLKKAYPNKKMSYVYASSKGREERVYGMREGKWDWLLTTTILERGVTFTNVHVIVMQAEHRVFNTASLIQIAGRVGRKKAYPTGDVYYCYKVQSRGMKESIRKIKEMNRHD